jgi:ketose-bisphosphate aldolase
MFFSQKSELKKILYNARIEKRAVGQFNFSALEQLKGIALASKETNTPVICATSQGEANFFGIEEAVAMVKTIREKENVRMFLNLDHGKDFDILKKAVDAGYDMVHFDGSEMPIEESTKIAKKIVAYAEKRGVVVEGEISKIGGKSTVSEGKPEETTLTSLEKIVKFISDTKIDCIALDIGNVHGVYSEAPVLHLERISELISIVSCFVVLHGGSGIQEEDIKMAIKRGVVKININTELRFAWKEAIYKVLKENEKEIVPYKILPLARDAVCEKVKEKINIFN